MKVCFETFGCRLNRAEALDEEARCAAAGHEIVKTHAEADIVVVRGCSVTARAQRDSERLVAHIRRKYPLVKVLVEGCLRERRGEDSTLTAETRRLVFAQPGTEGAVPTRTARAYLKVQDGCNSSCTFCIVPQFRGKASSVPFAAALDRAKRFVDAGYHEIVVTGCNLSQYASDGKGFADLVAALAELDAGCRIRLGSLEPCAGAAETVAAVAEHANVCRFLHLPIQSGSDRLLMAMRRPYRLREVNALVAEARRRMPEVGLGCDLMTGFPGETELDHASSVGLLKRLPFSNVHVFPFSERPGTQACVLAHSVPKELRSSRAHELSRRAAHNRHVFAERFLGRTVEVVIEDEAHLAGWTGEYLWCEAMNLSDAGTDRALWRRKSIVKVSVQKASHEGILKGKIV